MGVWWIQSQAVLPVLVHSSITKYIICPRLVSAERPYCLSYKIWGPCKQTTSSDSSLDHRFCRWHRGVVVWVVWLIWLKLNWQRQLGVPGFESRTWHTKITKLEVWWIQSQAVLPVLVHSFIPKYIICPRLVAAERPYCLSYKIWGLCKQTTSLDSSLDHRFVDGTVV